MAEYRNGLYYESKDIRNWVLERNIGEYVGYRPSFLINGGLAVGMPYAVETEFVPHTLAEKGRSGFHLGLFFNKGDNPKLRVLRKEGGLFGYTHEVLNNDYDPLSRSANILESFYDYDSTEDLREKLDKYPMAYSWGLEGLHPYSKQNFDVDEDYNGQRSDLLYDDYRDYIRTIFTNGLSFDKSLGERYLNDRLYVSGFNREDTAPSVQDFIEEKSGYITDDVETLKNIEDTRTGFIGRIMLDEAKIKQINGINERLAYNEGNFEHTPITFDNDLMLGLGTENTDDYRLGISAYNDTKVEFRQFIDDADSVLGTLDYTKDSFQQDLLRKHIRRNRFNSFVDNKGPYVEYYNVFDYTSHLDLDENGSIDQSEEGLSNNLTIQNKNVLGDSVEGFFKGAGIFDGTVSQNEHYDERDIQYAGERNILSEKISYDGAEYIGADAGSGFSTQPKSLLSKTKALFDQHKIKTLIGRFHTSNDDRNAKNSSAVQTALDPTYGISHGRNLLKLNKTYENGYENPYCRVWTYHHQYSKMTDLIRPFVDEGGNFMPLDALQTNYPGRPILRNPGNASWAEKTVLNKNGMVNIAPTTKIGKSDAERVKAKQCMFSIENLAWKGVNKDKSVIDEGEIGPLGGRIMWFPPYNLSFNESVSVSWGSNDFIGRGERIYSYTNTERTGTLSFTILADHPSILDYWRKEKYGDGPGDEEGDQKVLRFFAGCDTLEAPNATSEGISGVKDIEYSLEKKETTVNNPEKPQENTDPEPQDNTNEKIEPTPPDEFTKDNSISFYVYFPNNLSGVDFMSNPKVIVNYLVNGRNGFEFTPNLDGDPEHHILPTEKEVIGDWSDNIAMLTNGPGYEMGRSEGSGLTETDTINEVTTHNKKPSNVKGKNFLWGYGIDKVYVTQTLCGPNSSVKLGGNGSFRIFPKNYVDNTDHKLNAEPNKYDESCGYSFADVAVALTTDYRYSGKGENQERVNKIKEILGIQDSNVRNQGRKYYFAIGGGASVHGYGTSNDKLSRNRGLFLKTWLEYCFGKLNLQVDYDEESKVEIKTGISGGENNLDINSESAKRGRYAKAVIYWSDEDVKDATDADTEYVEGDTNEDTITIKEKTEAAEQEVGANGIEPTETTTSLGTTILRDFSSTRYRDEEEFFSMVKESDPVLYKEITNKVKYFDPVYHSITPEGFNLRLAFLHQCTRQGPTMSSSDISQNNGINKAGYAGNLSFGRAPVCVLRLGDFFNTRIIINSVSIQYETGQWDLNPEGIGVQPMLANVTLGFVFQGGSSLGGPIQRLQNAVSFNYYANQEVYDDRSDVAVYENGELSKASYVWVPGFGGGNIGDVASVMDMAKQNGEKKSYQRQLDGENSTSQTVTDELYMTRKEKVHFEQQQGVKEGTEIINNLGQ